MLWVPNFLQNETSLTSHMIPSYRRSVTYTSLYMCRTYSYTSHTYVGTCTYRKVFPSGGYLRGAEVSTTRWVHPFILKVPSYAALGSTDFALEKRRWYILDYRDLRVISQSPHSPTVVSFMIAIRPLYTSLESSMITTGLLSDACEP